MEINKKTKYYIAGALVGLLAYLWYRNHKASQNAAAVNAATTQTTPGSDTGNASTSFAPLATSPNPVTDLYSWLQSAQTYATSNLGTDPATTQNALQAYANGECLSQQEYNIIDKLLGALGSPPNAPFSGVQLCAGGGTSTGTDSGAGTSAGGTGETSGHLGYSVPASAPSAPSATPPTSTSSPVPSDLPGQLMSQLDAAVGQLSGLTGLHSTRTQVKTWEQNAPSPLNTVAGQFWLQSQNIGNISRQLPNGGGVSSSQASSLAQQLASEQGYSWSSLNTFEQNQYMQLANVQLLTANAQHAGAH